MNITSSISIDSHACTINKPKLLNPQFEPLTLEKLKSFKGNENISNENAIEVLKSVEQFAQVLYGAIKNTSFGNTNSIDNQLVVYLDSHCRTQSPVIPIHKNLKNKVA